MPKLHHNEVGFAICRTPSGQLTNGPVVEGDPMSVNIPTVCPPGSKLEGLWHTHPNGYATPSPIDIASAVKVRAPKLCITNDTETRCFVVRKG